LIEVFPLIGDGIRVKRFEETNKDIWKVEVGYLYPKNEGCLAVEYTYIYKNNYLIEVDTPE
jgi:hypothetical protein